MKGTSKTSRSGSANSSGVPGLRDLASKYLGPVERRLRGLHGSKTGVDKALNTLSYVDWLIKEAGDPSNLVSICATSTRQGFHSDYRSKGFDVSGLGSVALTGHSNQTVSADMEGFLVVRQPFCWHISIRADHTVDTSTS